MVQPRSDNPLSISSSRVVDPSIKCGPGIVRFSTCFAERLVREA